MGEAIDFQIDNQQFDAGIGYVTLEIIRPGRSEYVKPAAQELTFQSGPEEMIVLKYGYALSLGTSQTKLPNVLSQISLTYEIMQRVKA